MARRPSPSLSPPQAVLSPDRMRLGILRLERCIAQVEAFDPKTIQTDEDTSKSDALSALVDAALGQTFGDGTVEYQRYSGAAMFSWPLNMMNPTPIHEIQDSLRRCRIRSLELLRQAVSFLKQEFELQGSEIESNSLKSAATRKSLVGTNVVIGHGGRLCGVN